MTSELSFLLDLLLNQKLPQTIKELLVARIKEVEANLSTMPARQPVAMNISGFLPPNPTGVPQAASTLAALARHADAGVVMPPVIMPPPAPVAVIAQTPATVAAMNDRNKIISQAISGKPEKGQTSPRKW